MKPIGACCRGLAWTSLVMAIALGWPVLGQPSQSPPRLPGYLGPAGVPNEQQVLPPPPAPGSIAGKADLAAFRKTRSQRDTDRWWLATSDAAVDPASMLGAFACSLGAKFRPQDLPAFSRLMQRTTADASLLIGPPKDKYSRPRPFLRARGPVCTRLSPEFSRSGSYPSGHSTLGWLYALILAEAAPDRASELLARGRTFGESRIICGVHYVSDVEAGQTVAAGLTAVLNSNRDFRNDLNAAKAELEQLRPNAVRPDAATCAIEQEAARMTLP